MADTIYRPISDDSDEETPSPQVDFKIESYSDFRQALKDHAGATDHDVSAEEVSDASPFTREQQRETTCPDAVNGRRPAVVAGGKRRHPL